MTKKPALVEIPISPLRFVLLWLGVFAIAALFCSLAQGQWPYTAVCELQNGNSGGSATLVAFSENKKQARLLSCWHVFENGVRSPYVRFVGREGRFPCRVLGTNQRYDLSMLEIDNPPDLKTPLCIRAARPDDKFLVAVGFPYYSRDNAHWSKGAFMRYSGSDCHFSAPVHSGYSGGALFAPDGALVGVVCGYGRGYSYAPSGKALLDFASRYVEVER